MALEFPSSITVSPFSSPLFQPQAFQTGMNPLSEPPAGPGQNLDEIIRKAKGALFTPGAAADPNQAVLKAAQAAQAGGANIPVGEPTPAAGGGGRVQPGGISPDSAMKAVKNLIDLFKSGPTRGDTGGVSLSDQLRSAGSAGGGAAGGIASALPGFGDTVPAGASQGLTLQSPWDTGGPATPAPSQYLPAYANAMRGTNYDMGTAPTGAGVGGDLFTPIGGAQKSMIDLANQLLSQYKGVLPEDQVLGWAKALTEGNLGDEILGFGGNTAAAAGAGATGAGAAGAGAGAGGAASGAGGAASAGSSLAGSLGAGAANAALGLLLRQLGAPPELATAATMGGTMAEAATGAIAPALGALAFYAPVIQAAIEGIFGDAGVGYSSYAHDQRAAAGMAPGAIRDFENALRWAGSPSELDQAINAAKSRSTGIFGYDPARGGFWEWGPLDQQLAPINRQLSGYIDQVRPILELAAKGDPTAQQFVENNRLGLVGSYLNALPTWSGSAATDPEAQRAQAIDLAKLMRFGGDQGFGSGVWDPYFGKYFAQNPARGDIYQQARNLLSSFDSAGQAGSAVPASLLQVAMNDQGPTATEIFGRSIIPDGQGGWIYGTPPQYG